VFLQKFLKCSIWDIFIIGNVTKYAQQNVWNVWCKSLHREEFLRSKRLFSWSKTFPQFTEPKWPLHSSQKFALMPGIQ
jgi:hypothetical protein